MTEHTTEINRPPKIESTFSTRLSATLDFDSEKNLKKKSKLLITRPGQSQGHRRSKKHTKGKSKINFLKKNLDVVVIMYRHKFRKKILQ
jgi:hypothetical protein